MLSLPCCSLRLTASLLASWRAGDGASALLWMGERLRAKGPNVSKASSSVIFHGICSDLVLASFLCSSRFLLWSEVRAAPAACAASLVPEWPSGSGIYCIINVFEGRREGTDADSRVLLLVLMPSVVLDRVRLCEGEIVPTAALCLPCLLASM